jgi:hypothetical protein
MGHVDDDSAAPEAGDREAPLDAAREDAERAARRASRANLPVRRFRLGEEPDEDLSAVTTMEERVAMMWPLSRLVYEIAGFDIEPPPRAELHGVVLRPDARSPREP